MIPVWLGKKVLHSTHVRSTGPFLAAVVIFVFLPVVVDVGSYVQGLLTLAFIFMSGAVAWNWLGGFAGQVSFGSAAMFGIGGFTSARLLLWSAALPFWASWFLGGLAAAAFAISWGHAALRLRGPYFSIATLGVAVATEIVATFWSGFTGGSSGLSLPLNGSEPSQYALYWYAIVVLLVVGICSYLLRKSRFGLALLAIRDDVEAASDTGVDPTFYQDVTLVVSSFAIGVTGALYACYNGYLVPNDMFGFSRSVEFVLMGVVGGLGTIFGPMIGAFVFVTLDQLLLSSFPNISLGLYGLLLILIILFEPQGITGLLERVSRTFLRMKKLGIDNQRSKSFNQRQNDGEWKGSPPDKKNSQESEVAPRIYRGRS